MKLHVNKYRNDKFFISCGEHFSDEELASCLDLSYEEYIDILLQNGANRYQENNTVICYDFNSREDAENAIKSLEPYLIMIKLVEGE